MSNKHSITVFAGKGGVGKTTCAATTAFHYASQKKSTLAISTDATPSLSHIFEVAGGGKPIQVLEYLNIHELGLNEAKEMWDKKFGREVYEVFSSFVSIDYEYFVEFMTSLLPGLSDEFMVDYIRELSQADKFQTIVWDTAPLGQTLALLETPAMLRQHLKMAPRIYSKLKLGQNREPILSIIKRWEKLSADDMDFLRNEVGFVLVTIPEALAVEQLNGISHELDRCGFKVKQLIINNVARVSDSYFMSTKIKGQKPHLDFIHQTFSHLKIIELPMFPYELRGVERLREAEKVLFNT